MKILTQKKENVYIDENKAENSRLYQNIQRKKTLQTPPSATSPRKFSLLTPIFVEKMASQLTTNPNKNKSPGAVGGLMNSIRKKKMVNIHEILKRDLEENSEDLNEKLKNFGYAINELTTGESFGEKALLGEAGRRTATVVAATYVELLVIKKRNFLEITQKFNIEKEKKRKILMKALPFLKTIRSANNLENLLYCFKEENLVIGFSVTEENTIDPEEKIYFLAEGRCKIERKYFQKIENQTILLNCQITEVNGESIIGEEILFDEESYYKYTVSVSIFFIFKKELLKLFIRLFPISLIFIMSPKKTSF